MNTPNKKLKASVLVTGVSGLSGSLVIKEFVKQNIPVRALVRNRVKVKEFEGYANVEVYEGDMLIPQTLRAVFHGIEKALMISFSDEKTIDTQQCFIDTAKEAGVPHVIKYSGADSGIGFNSQNFIAQNTNNG